MSDKMLKFVKIGQQTPPKREIDVRKKDFNEIYDEFINEKAKDQSSRCSQCGVPFCQVHCPLSNNIPDWLKLTAEGRIKEAYEVSQSTNFSLNDDEFSKIKELSNQVDSEVLILFWQFAISSLEELDIVSNQHLSIEMFLIRLMHLSSIKLNKNSDLEQSNDNLDNQTANKENEQKFEDNSRIINQIKNIAQEEKQKPEVKPEIKAIDKNFINSFDDLLNICTLKKEIKLKYELEKNVNLVKFERNRIEISFNDNLDKDFVKDLSSKLYEWTGERWIITFSKSKGEMSVKEKQKNKKDELMNEVKSLEIYKQVMEKFPDAELIDVKLNEKKED